MRSATLGARRIAKVAKTNKSLLIALILFAVGLTPLFFWNVALVGFLTDPFLRYLGLTFLLLAIAVVGISWGSVSLAAGKFDILELPVWYTLWAFLGYVLFGLFIFNEQLSYQSITLQSLQWVADGLWLLILGFFGLWLGYRLTWVFLKDASLKADLRSQVGNIHQPSFAGTTAVYLLTIIIRLVHVVLVGTAFGSQISHLGQLAGFNQWFIYAEQARFFLIAIIALQVFRRRWSFQVLIILTILELVYSLFSGFTIPIIWLILTIWASYSSVGSRLQLSWRAWGLFFLLSVAIFIALPISVQYRSFITSGTVNNRSIASISTGVVDAMISANNDRAFSRDALFDKTFNRQESVLQTLGIILHTTPAVIPHWGVERLLLIPFYIIPRAIWPNKPNLSTGNYLAIAYLGSPQGATNSAGATMVGDLYLNAGWTAVFVGMFIWGIVCAVLYYFLKVKPMRKGNLPLVALYIGLAALLADFEGTYIGLAVGLVQRLVVFSLLYWILHPTLRRKRLVRGKPTFQPARLADAPDNYG